MQAYACVEVDRIVEVEEWMKGDDDSCVKMREDNYAKVQEDSFVEVQED